MIEARNIQSCSTYLKENRYGRKLGLNPNKRTVIWRTYQKWKEILNSLGYTSIGEVRQKALDIVLQKRLKLYDAVIIDEAQDLSPVALELLASIVKSPKGLYLTADTSQSLYQRGFSWHYIRYIVGFEGRTRSLMQSYQSTQGISQACFDILRNTEAGDAETFLTIPNEWLMGDKPKLILADDWIANPQRIKDFFVDSAKRFKLPIYSSAVLCPDILICKIIAQSLRKIGLKAAYLEEEEIDVQKCCIKVLTLHSAKGLEFPFVAVVGLEEGYLPKVDNLVNEERDEILNQQRRLFYVGCSRAMRSLLVCGSQTNPSQFINALRESKHWEKKED